MTLTHSNFGEYFEVDHVDQEQIEYDHARFILHLMDHAEYLETLDSDK